MFTVKHVFIKNVYKWVKLFKSRNFIQDEVRLGWPTRVSTLEMVDLVNALILPYGTVTTGDIFEQMEISVGIAHKNFFEFSCW